MPAYPPYDLVFISAMSTVFHPRVRVRALVFVAFPFETLYVYVCEIFESFLFSSLTFYTFHFLWYTVSTLRRRYRTSSNVEDFHRDTRIACLNSFYSNVGRKTIMWA